MAFSSCWNTTLSITLVTKKTLTSTTNQILTKMPNSGRPNGSYPICKRLFFPGVYLVPFRVTELHRVISAAAGKSSRWNRLISRRADSLSFPRRFFSYQISHTSKEGARSGLGSTIKIVIFFGTFNFLMFRRQRECDILKIFIFFR